jgi:WXG100 family type VII secretion target
LAETISAEEGALKTGQEAVRDAKVGIDNQAKKVHDQILQLSGYWKGSAASSFTNMMTRWDEEARKLNDVLITLENSLLETERDQAETEIAHDEAIKGLDAMMSGS